MPLSRRLLQPLLSRALVHPRLRSLLQARYEWFRRLRNRPHQIIVWLQINDPYSYILIQVLPRLAEHFPVTLLFRILPYQEPDHTFSHHVRDAWYLAQFHQLSFQDFQPPDEDNCLLASQLLLANRHLPNHDYLILAKQVFQCLWEHQFHKLSTLALRFPVLAVSTTRKKMAAAQQRFLSFNQDKPAQLQYHGDWYWCLDDIDDLAECLDAAGISNFPHRFVISGEHNYLDNDYLINDWEQLASIRAQKYELDYYFSFNDPLSYIYLAPVMALAEHYQLKLALKPVLLEQFDDNPPGWNWYGQLQRLARLAQRYDAPFGKICLATDQGVQACLALMEAGREQGMEQDMILALMTSIWAHGKDVSHLPHLRQILGSLNCEIPQLKKRLRSYDWLPQIEQYTVEWSHLDVPGLPSFYLQGERRIAFSGAHRLWAIEMAIVDNMRLIGST